MRRSLGTVATIALVSFQPACTFVTSCPTTQSGNNGNGGGGSGGTGGPSSFPSIGLPHADWTNVTSNLAGLPSECGNLSQISAKPDEDMLIAGVPQEGIWSSRDGGQSWQALGAGAGSDPITNRMSAIVYDPAHTNVFWESGTYNGGGVYRTDDDGKTILALGNVAHTDLVSVDFSDPNRQTLLAGGHEQAKTLNLSVDGGKSWRPTGAGLPDKTNCTNPLIIDSKTFLVGCGGYGGGVTGIYRSEDGGVTWSSVSELGGVWAPLHAADGSIYWSTPSTNVLARSTDDGQTWQQVTGPDVLQGLSPVELPDGRIAALAKNGVGVVVSSDSGATWALATSALPYPDASGLVYSAQQKAFYIFHFDCGNFVLSDAIMRCAFDYEASGS